MTAPAPASAASSLPPDSRPATGTGTGSATATGASSLRRFGRLPSNSNSTSTSNNNYHHPGSHRPNRNPLATRFPRFAPSSNSPDLSSATGSLPIPCAPPTVQSSVISRYRQAFLGCYRDVGVDLQASSPESLVSVSSDESDAEGDTQGTMARLRRQRTSSQTSQSPDPSHPPDTRDPQRGSSRSSSPPRSSSNLQAASPPVPPDSAPAVNTAPPESTSTPENTSTTPRSNKKATIRFYPHQDVHRNTRPSLHFIPVSRTLPSDNSVIRVGRYSERDGVPVANPAGPSGAPVGFKSKVVSRRHCEFLYINSQWHVKDVGSSSGT